MSDNQSNNLKAAFSKYLLGVVRPAMKLMHASDDYESLNLIRVLAGHYLENPVATTSQEENE